MQSNEKMWAFLVNMGAWEKAYQELPFDEALWDYIVDEAEKTGINTLVIDIGGAIAFASHPELTLKGAWTRGRFRRELERCRQKGITLIPKLNFSATHHFWLGEYGKMVSTTTYYKVCSDMIKEAYELFDHPKYIHLGMDEESYRNVASRELVVFRQGELFWHDLRFLIDCVRDTGAMPWIWACPLFDHPEEFKQHIDADEVIISPWYYHAFRKEHWTPIDSHEEYRVYYGKSPFKEMNLTYVEEDPFHSNVRKWAIPLLKEGYRYIPCAATATQSPYAVSDLVEYFRDNTPEAQLPGFIMATWRPVLMKNKQKYEDAFRLFREAREQFY